MKKILICCISLSLLSYIHATSFFECKTKYFPSLSIFKIDAVDHMTQLCLCMSGSHLGFIYAQRCPGCPKWDAVINNAKKRTFYIKHCPGDSPAYATASGSAKPKVFYYSKEEIIKLLKSGKNKYDYMGL